MAKPLSVQQTRVDPLRYALFMSQKLFWKVGVGGGVVRERVPNTMVNMNKRSMDLYILLYDSSQYYIENIKPMYHHGHFKIHVAAPPTGFK